MTDDQFRVFYGLYYGDSAYPVPVNSSQGVVAWYEALRSHLDEEYDRRTGSTLRQETDYRPVLQVAAKMMTDQELAVLLEVANRSLTGELGMSLYDPFGRYQYYLGMLLLEEQRRRS